MCRPRQQARRSDYTSDLLRLPPSTTDVDERTVLLACWRFFGWEEAKLKQGHTST